MTWTVTESTELFDSGVAQGVRLEMDTIVDGQPTRIRQFMQTELAERVGTEMVSAAWRIDPTYRRAARRKLLWILLAAVAVGAAVGVWL